MQKLVTCVFLMIVAASANASIIYNVDRSIGAGTVSGFIETDGTQGVLATANITDWTLTLTAPNLLGGPNTVIDFAAQNNTEIMGNALTATATHLLFDFDLPGVNFFILQGALPNANYWCVETALCVGINTTIESIGRNASGGPVSQSVTRAGTARIATAIPEPTTLVLLAFGLAGLRFSRRSQHQPRVPAASRR